MFDSLIPAQRSHGPYKYNILRLKTPNDILYLKLFKCTYLVTACEKLLEGAERWRAIAQFSISPSSF